MKININHKTKNHEFKTNLWSVTNCSWNRGLIIQRLYLLEHQVKQEMLNHNYLRYIRNYFLVSGISLVRTTKDES
jgi:hypothetical protein